MIIILSYMCMSVYVYRRYVYGMHVHTCEFIWKEGETEKGRRKRERERGREGGDLERER